MVDHQVTGARNDRNLLHCVLVAVVRDGLREAHDAAEVVWAEPASRAAADVVQAPVLLVGVLEQG